MTYETLYVDTAEAPLPAGTVDSVAFWNQKPDGIIGKCSLIGFNSRKEPIAHPQPENGWQTDFAVPCSNVNLWVPFSRFDISADGALAVAWVQADSGNVTIYGLEGQTGKIKWNVTAGTSPQYSDYFLCYGANIAKNGQWVVYDEGIEGGPGTFHLHVLSALDGSERASVPSIVSTEGILSPDGDFIISIPHDTAPQFTVLGWDQATHTYKEVATVTAPIPSGAVGDTWDLGGCSFGQVVAPVNKTIVACGWFSTDLAGEVVAAVYDVAHMAAGPISVYLADGIDNNMALAGMEVRCAGSLCAVALQTQVTGGKQPTVVMLDGSGDAGAMGVPFFNYTSRGTMNSVSISVGSTAGAPAYYVSAAGCTTLGGCQVPGADAYLWQVTGL